MNLLSRVWGCFRGGSHTPNTTGLRENVFPSCKIGGLISPLPILLESGEGLSELKKCQSSFHIDKLLD